MAIDGHPVGDRRDPRIPGYVEHPLPVLLAFLVFVVARYMQWGARRDIFATIRIEFTLGFLLTVVCVGLLLQRPVNVGPARNVLIGIGMLFAVMLTQLPFALDPMTAQQIFYDRVIKFAMQTFFMVVLLQSPRYMRYFMYAYLFSCFYITQESVRGLISGGLVWENQGVMRLHGAVPIYTHPNSLGGLAMGAIPFVVFLFGSWRTWYYRGALLALGGTSLTCVLYTGSRTAYVAFIAFLIFWWLSVRRKLKWLAIVVIVGSIGVAVMPAQYRERFESIGGEEVEGRSREARIQILQDALIVLAENPGGVGVASFPAARMQRFGRFQDTHNLYLEVATNLGLQGFVVFMFLIIALLSAYRQVSRRLRQQAEIIVQVLDEEAVPKSLRAQLTKHSDDLRFLMAVSTAAAGFVYVRLALGLFGMDLYEIYWWFGAGLAISLLNVVSSTTHRTRALLAAIKTD